MASTPSRRDDIKGMGCLTLFGLPFAAVGTFMGWMIFSSLRNSYEMRSWTEVPATILEAELESHPGDDSTTYSVKALYRYQVGGRAFESDRVSIHLGADNIGRYHQNLARTLEAHAASGEPYPCFVDPADPSRAILDRNPRWGMVGFYSLFLLTFGGVGWGMILGGLVTLRRSSKVKREVREEPEDSARPWLRREDWSEGLVRYSDRGPAFGALIFAMLWNLISAPILFILPEEIAKGNYPALLGLAFPLVGAGMVVWAARGMLRWRRYGESTLFLDRVPIPLGAMLAGRVEIGARLEPAEGFEWTLSCVQRRRKASGNESSSESVLWQDRGHAPYERQRGLGAHTVIPLQLEIPAQEAPATSIGDTGESICWRLDLAADVDGVDYRGRFDLPVFGSAAPVPVLASVLGAVAKQREAVTEAGPWEALPQPPRSPEAPDLDPRELEVGARDLAAARVRARPLAGRGRRFYLPMARQPGTAFSVTLFWLVWNGALVFMLKAGAPWLFPAVFGLFGLLLTYSLLDLWFGAHTIEADETQLALSSTLFGVGRRVEIPAAEVQALLVEKGMQSGSQLYYRVAARTTAGKKYTAATRLPGRRPALALKAAIEAALEG